MTPQIIRKSRQLLSRPHMMKYIAELLVFIASGLGAFLLRFEFSIPPMYMRSLLIALPIWMMAKFVLFYYSGLHRRWWRFFSVNDALRLALTNLGASATALSPILAFAPLNFPRSIPIIDFFLCSAGTFCIFVARRAFWEANTSSNRRGGRNTIIYGAGSAGVTLMRELRANPGLGQNVCGFVDDNPAMAGMFVQDVPVYGAGSALPAAVASTGAEEVLIAIPSATGKQLVTILNSCQEAGVRFRAVCPLGEMIAEKGLASQIREVDVQDLLGRSAARLDHQEISHRVEGKVVMVTGAAGSIGSELCFQLARFKPAAIIAFDNGETALFHLDRQMREKFPGVRFCPEIGSVRSPARVGEVIQRYKPSMVFHSAAYKHVPLMESSIFEAMENNVFGTWNVAVAARDFGVADFVLISSDKAVRPTSVMGATKRLCELVILSLRGHRTRFVAVRFGNVLGSNGSVIPLFKSQIAAGGPVTVTHPDMRRYFMTIPEAAQLVLQASVMGRSGEIFVLDMGEPMKIVDLAKNLILLSGLRPDVDVKIEFSGARPGEKLYEELNCLDEETLPTHHAKIKIFKANDELDGDMVSHLRVLDGLCEARDARGVILFLKDLIQDYNPSAHILRESMPPAPSVVRETADSLYIASRRRLAVG